MSEGRPLETGWLSDTPADDNLLRATLANMVERVRLVAASVGGTVDEDDAAIVAVTSARSVFANPVVLMRPLGASEASTLVDRLADLLGDTPALIESPWPTPDLSTSGLHLFGHPPFMVREPGAAPGDGPDGLDVHEVTTPDGMAAVERTLIDGFPVADLDGAPDGTLLGPALAGGPFYQYVGEVAGRPVTTAAAMVGAGVVSVENVATLPEDRGHGYGEAVTWAATCADPHLPAVLIASDPGRPVYDRMGYRAVFRWTLWGWTGPAGD